MCVRERERGKEAEGETAEGERGRGRKGLTESMCEREGGIAEEGIEGQRERGGGGGAMGRRADAERSSGREE